MLPSRLIGTVSATHSVNRQFSVIAVLAICIALGSSAVLNAKEVSSKEKATPSFWQKDPNAGFEDEGRMHCAPTAVSGGLIYLSRNFGWKDLVVGTSHNRQIEIINDLAKKLHTDPSSGGTNPDRILSGLRTYVKSHGHVFDRLEVMTWRNLSIGNQKFSLGTKPKLEWLRKAARSEDTVVVANFGWYYAGENGYTRKGGHWVNVVGADADAATLQVRNPYLPTPEQTVKTSVTLTPLDNKFTVAKTDETTAVMTGYFHGNGPGLPHGKTVVAVLDAVIVFSLKK